MPAISIHYNTPVYLSKFLTKLLGNPYNLRSDDHIISRYILRSLYGKFYTLSKPLDEYKISTQLFTVIIPPYINAKHNAFSITVESERDFIFEIEQYFQASLFTYIRAHQDIEEDLIKNNIKGSIKTCLAVKNAIYRFIDIYDINEQDIKMDTLIKRYQRSRENPIFS